MRGSRRVRYTIEFEKVRSVPGRPDYVAPPDARVVVERDDTVVCEVDVIVPASVKAERFVHEVFTGTRFRIASIHSIEER